MSIDQLERPGPEPDNRPGLANRKQHGQIEGMAKRLLASAAPLVGTEGVEQNGVRVTFEAVDEHKNAAHYFTWLGDQGGFRDIIIEQDTNTQKLEVVVDTVLPAPQGGEFFDYQREHYPMEYGIPAVRTNDRGVFAEDGHFDAQGPVEDMQREEMTTPQYNSLRISLNMMLQI